MEKRAMEADEELARVANSLAELGGVELDRQRYDSDRLQEARRLLIEYLASEDVRNSYTKRQRKVIDKHLLDTDRANHEAVVAGMSYRLQASLLSFRGSPSSSWVNIQDRRHNLLSQHQRLSKVKAKNEVTAAMRLEASAIADQAQSDADNEWSLVAKAGFGEALAKFRDCSGAAPFELIAGWIATISQSAPRQHRPENASPSSLHPHTGVNNLMFFCLTPRRTRTTSLGR
jgi:hypothetical protein